LIVYLQHSLSVIEGTYTLYFVGVAKEGVESDELYSFFLSLRVLALLVDVNRPFPAGFDDRTNRKVPKTAITDRS
jgi:hypothetical protein